MIAWIIWTVAEVGVQGTPTCVDAAAVGAAVDAVGGVDVAERVTLAVAPVQGIGGQALHAVTIDIALIGAEPLHRELSIRPLECADLPDLVAVLVRQQRAAARAAPAVRLPPVEPRRHTAFDDRASDDRNLVAWGPCDGPPDCAGPPLTLIAGPLTVVDLGDHGGVGLGPHIVGDATLSGDPGLVMGGQIYTARTTAAAAAIIGAAFGHAIGGGQVSVRTTIGGGVRASFDGGGPPVGVLPVLVPGVAGRFTFGWLALEAGALVEVPLGSLPIVGLHAGIGLSAL